MAVLLGVARVAVPGNGLLFLSGQIPIDPATGAMLEGDIIAQTDRVMKNLQAVLEDVAAIPKGARVEIEAVATAGSMDRVSANAPPPGSGNR